MPTKRENGLGNEQVPIDFRMLAASISENNHIMSQRLEEISHQLAISTAAFERHIEEDGEELKIIRELLVTSVNRIRSEALSGFPNKDPIKHHDYHIEIIGDAADRKKRNQEIMTFIIKSTLWAVLGIIGTALWFYIKAQVKL